MVTTIYSYLLPCLRTEVQRHLGTLSRTSVNFRGATGHWILENCTLHIYTLQYQYWIYISEKNEKWSSLVQLFYKKVTYISYCSKNVGNQTLFYFPKYIHEIFLGFNMYHTLQYHKSYFTLVTHLILGPQRENCIPCKYISNAHNNCRLIPMLCIWHYATSPTEQTRDPESQLSTIYGWPRLSFVSSVKQ
jgi:hypothetical protein